MSEFSQGLIGLLYGFGVAAGVAVIALLVIAVLSGRRRR